jgi:hypothetical protein
MLSAGAEKKAESYTLSDTDIKSLLGGDAKITTYPDLANVSDINQLFDRKGRAIIFFPQDGPNVGHWCAMIRDGRQIEFFDSYGQYPDTQKPDAQEQRELRMDRPLLTRLLENSGCRVIYNKVALQKSKDDVQTCGRHVVVRLMYSKYPIGKYRSMIKSSGLSPDQFVVRQTAQILGK